MHGVKVDGVGRQRLGRRRRERRREVPEAQPVDGRLTSRAPRALLLQPALPERRVVLRVGGGCGGGRRGGAGCKWRQVQVVQVHNPLQFTSHKEEEIHSLLGNLFSSTLA